MIALLVLLACGGDDTVTPPEPPPTGTIRGAVSVEGAGLDGVSVSLGSGASTTTAGGGQFSFANVPAGSYNVSITGFPSDARFSATSMPATISTPGQTVNVNFSGSWIRTSAINVEVSVEGSELDGVTVRLSGPATGSAVTSGGRVAFDNLRAGRYTVEISGYDEGQVSFGSTSETVSVAANDSETVEFDGAYVRTSEVRVAVRADGDALQGVDVALTGPDDRSGTTDSAGRVEFDNLRAGRYTVEISGYDAAQVSFQSDSETFDLGANETRTVEFAGAYLSNATIRGRVTVDGAGLAGVAVTLAGPRGASVVTRSDGRYEFTELPRGQYTVSISGFPAGVEFDATTVGAAVETPGATVVVDFAGRRTASSSIVVRVRAGNDPLGNVNVALTGQGADLTRTTDSNGQALFGGLRAGSYTVSISGFDTNSITFPGGTSQNVTVATNQHVTASFLGQYAGASVTGGLYYDEAPRNDAYSTGEVFLAASGIAVVLEGPTVGQRRSGNTGPNGRFNFPNLAPGAYSLRLAPSAVLPAGVAYGGPGTGIIATIVPGQTTTAHIPLDITHQTVRVGARLHNGSTAGPVLPGVTVALYSDAAQANELARGLTGANGLATLQFQRNLVPAPSSGGDYTVYASAVNPHTDLAPVGAMPVPVSYRREPVTDAGHMRFVNRRATFRFAVRAIDDPRGIGIPGADRPLSSWDAEVSSGGSALGTRATDAAGAAGFDHVDALVPRNYSIELTASQSQAMGQDWQATAHGAGTQLVYVHDGLVPPGATANAGTLRVEFTTQRLVVGVHWERDHQQGYNPGVDLRPNASTANLEVELLFVDPNGIARSFSQAGLANPQSPNPAGHATHSGLAVFDRLPTDTRFTIETSVVGGADIMILEPDYISTFSLDPVHRGSHSRGGFGDLGGAYPEVRICPLTKSGNHCSTAAYVWTNNRVEGRVDASDGSGIDTLEVTLTPVGGGAIGAVPMTVTTPTMALAGSYDFDGLPDGRYEIRVTGTALWQNSVVLSCNFNRAADGPGGSRSPCMRSPRMIYQAGTIAGVVANDFLNPADNMVNSEETMAGIVVELHDQAGYAANPNAAPLATRQTDAMGGYEFTGLAENDYLVRVPETNNIQAHHGMGVAHDVSPVLALTYPAVDIDRMAMLPQWDYGNSVVAD